MINVAEILDLRIIDCETGKEHKVIHISDSMIDNEDYISFNLEEEVQ